MKISSIMTRDVQLIDPDETDADDVADNMGEQQLRRLPVLNDEKRLVGIVSLGDIAGSEEVDASGEALRGISQPGGLHSQSSQRQ